MTKPIETIATQLLRQLDAQSLIEVFDFVAKIQNYVVKRARAEQAELQNEELWERESTKVRRMLARQLDRLPFERENDHTLRPS